MCFPCSRCGRVFRSDTELCTGARLIIAYWEQWEDQCSWRVPLVSDGWLFVPYDSLCHLQDWKLFLSSMRWDAEFCEEALGICLVKHQFPPLRSPGGFVYVWKNRTKALKRHWTCSCDLKDISPLIQEARAVYSFVTQNWRSPLDERWNVVNGTSPVEQTQLAVTKDDLDE